MSFADEFKNKKYCIIENFFEQSDVQRMADRMNLLYKRGILTKDVQCPDSPSAYGDPIHSEMQEKYRYKLAEMLGISLLPTYTYSRIYAPKEILKFHNDRPSCEISLTSTLEYNTFDDKPWKIFVETDEHDPQREVSLIKSHDDTTLEKYGRSYYLYPGDILVYRGCDLHHWRESFIGVKQSQIFIHYVDAEGPYANYKYDGRPSLGSSDQTKKPIDPPPTVIEI